MGKKRELKFSKQVNLYISPRLEGNVKRAAAKARISQSRFWREGARLLLKMRGTEGADLILKQKEIT